MSLKTSFFAALIAVTISPLISDAQERRMMAPQSEPAEYTLPDGVHEASIPFKLVNNHVLIPLTINNTGPYDFILDTGMRDVTGVLIWEGAWVDDVTLDYVEGARVQIGGAGKGKEPVVAQIAKGVGVTIGDLRFADARAIVAPPPPFPLPYHDGVIGGAIFSNFVVTIDYDRHVIILTEPDHFAAPSGWTEIPMSFQMGIPYISAAADIGSNNDIPLTLVVDLGASHPVSLNTDADERIVVPTKSLTTEIGRGMSGPLTGFVARIDALSLGNLTVSHVVTTFPDSPHQFPRGSDGRSGNLGNGVLHHFNIVIDYRGDRMFLKPNSLFDEPFEWRMSGIVLGEEHDGGIEIGQIVDASPAFEAGLLAGDIILSINGTEVLEYEFEELTKLMRTEGNRLQLEIERAGKRRKLELTTRRLI